MRLLTRYVRYLALRGDSMQLLLPFYGFSVTFAVTELQLFQFHIAR